MHRLVVPLVFLSFVGSARAEFQTPITGLTIDDDQVTKYADKTGDEIVVAVNKAKTIRIAFATLTEKKRHFQIEWSRVPWLTQGDVIGLNYEGGYVIKIDPLTEGLYLDANRVDDGKSVRSGMTRPAIILHDHGEGKTEQWVVLHELLHHFIETRRVTWWQENVGSLEQQGVTYSIGGFLGRSILLKDESVLESWEAYSWTAVLGPIMELDCISTQHALGLLDDEGLRNSIAYFDGQMDLLEKEIDGLNNDGEAKKFGQRALKKAKAYRKKWERQ